MLIQSKYRPCSRVALVNTPSMTEPFVVRFLWLGGRSTAPGAQPFFVYALDALGQVEVLETGQTTAEGTVVPEPGTGTLLGLGGLGLALWHRVKRRRS